MAAVHCARSRGSGALAGAMPYLHLEIGLCLLVEDCEIQHYTCCGDVDRVDLRQAHRGLQVINSHLTGAVPTSRISGSVSLLSV